MFILRNGVLNRPQKIHPFCIWLSWLFRQLLKDLEEKEERKRNKNQNSQEPNTKHTLQIDHVSLEMAPLSQTQTETLNI